MTHVMIDLETMGTGPTAAIVAVAAIEFDPEVGTLGREFYRTIDLQSCIDSGLEITGSTVMWWLGQSEAARDALQDSPEPLHRVMDQFHAWFTKSAYVWSHGASSDLPILSNALQSVGLEKPWKYSHELDTRTILWLSGEKMPRNTGTAHNALDDARTQALGIIAALKTLKEPK